VLTANLAHAHTLSEMENNPKRNDERRCTKTLLEIARTSIALILREKHIVGTSQDIGSPTQFAHQSVDGI
jgi:hypothetical protein